MAKNPGTKSKRQAIREQRQRQQRQQRLILILVVSGIAIALAAILIGPSLRTSIAPVGEIVTVEPHERPLVDGRMLGDPNAPVVIEVWEDFQCPACRDFSKNIEPLLVQNFVANGQVRYIFRQYPFIDDKAPTSESDQAANGSMCAMEQGRFWDYHDILFANWNSENAGAFNDKRLVAFAETIGLDMNQFNTCFSENRYKDEINQDIVLGNNAGVTGTPSVFVNGKILTPGFVPGYDAISSAIEAELASAK